MVYAIARVKPWANNLIGIYKIHFDHRKKIIDGNQIKI